MSPTRALLAASIFILGIVQPIVAQSTYRDMPLDCGGWFSGFAQHSSGRLYGYGDIFGLYRSDDFGASWKFLQARMTDPGLNTFITGVTVHRLDANRVAFTSYGNVWTSTDGGDNWTTRLTDIYKSDSLDRGSKGIAYHPTQLNELWLAANRTGHPESLWRSTDNGASWAPIGGTSFVNERVRTIHINPLDPNQIWVGTAAIKNVSTLGGLWCSADAGVTWTKVWNNNGAQTVYYNEPQVHSIARNAAGVSVFATNNGVWQVTATDWNNPATYIATRRTWDDQTIPNVTVLADGSFWSSENGDQTWAPKVSTNGVTWTDRQITHSPATVTEWSTAAQITSRNRVYGRDMIVQDVNNPNRWLCTGGDSVHLSEDNGITFRYQPGGVPGIASYKVNFDRTNPLRAYIATSDRGIFVSNDGGLTGTTVYCSRKSINHLHTYHETMVSADGQTIVGAGINQEISRTVIVRSTDGGANWSEVTTSGLPVSYEGVTRAVMSPTDPNDFLVLLGWTDAAGAPNNPGLYRTTNGGANFSKVNGSTFDGVNTGARYHPENSYLERDGIAANTRYLSLRASNNSSVRGVWRSLDGGTTWDFRGDPFGGPSIVAFAVDPTIEGRLWAASGYLRRSDDGGGSWITVGDFISIGGLDVYGGRLVVEGRRTGDTINKIYYSPDNGQSWEEFSSPENRFGWAQAAWIDPWRARQVWVSGSRSIQLINPPVALDPVLTGTVTGSPAWSGDPTNTVAKAFDGNPTTFFAPGDNGSFATLDLGAGNASQLTAIRYFPRSDFISRMDGGRFEGSTNGSSWTTLATINGTPAGSWQTVTINASTSYRYYRYLQPTGLADVAELEFRGLPDAVPVILNQPLPAINAIVGQPVSYNVAAIGSPAPTLSIASGNLPAGLSLNATTGAITGTPTATASGTVTIQATNPSGTASVAISYSVQLGARISVTTPTPCYVQAANTTGTAPVILSNTGDAPLSWSAALPTVDGNDILAASTTPGSGVSYSWIDAINGGTKISFSGSDDENAGPITLPFAFPFYGTNQNTLRVCSNGWLSFTNTSSPYQAPPSLPNNTTNQAPENLIAPFYNDFYLRSDSGIYHRAVDAQTFVVSFIDLVLYADRNLSNPQRFSFQAVLNSDGRITFQYLNIPNLSISNRVIGIQNSTRTLGSNITLPSPMSDLTQRAYQLSPSLGWLSAISPVSSSAAGSTLAPGASTTLNATINTTGIATGQTRSATITFSTDDPTQPVLAVPFNLVVGTLSTPVIAANQTAVGNVGAAFNYQLATTSGFPTSYALASGSLPPGISLNTATGVLSGTPTVVGNYTPSFTATNSAGTSSPAIVNVEVAAVSLAIVYEPFNYTAGTNALASQNGGSGWTSSWNTATNDINTPGFVYSTGGDTLVTSGGRMTTQSGQGSFRILPARYTSGTYWFSFLAKSSTPGSGQYGGLSLFDSGIERAFFGQPNGTSNWAIDNGTTPATNSTANQAFIVVKVVLNSSDTDSAFLWVNPALNVIPLDANAANNRSGAEMSFDRLRIQSSTVVDLDEIRMGASFNQVAPITVPISALATFRTANGLSTNGSQDLLTPAGDGVASLLKYAFNMIGTGAGQAPALTTPNAAVLASGGTAGLPFASTESATGKLQINYIRRKATAAPAPGIIYAVEFSDALASWATNNAATESVTTIDATFERVIVTDSVAAPTERFVRLRVTAN